MKKLVKYSSLILLLLTTGCNENKEHTDFDVVKEALLGISEYISNPDNLELPELVSVTEDTYISTNTITREGAATFDPAISLKATITRNKPAHYSISQSCANIADLLIASNLEQYFVKGIEGYHSEYRENVNGDKTTSSKVYGTRDVATDEQLESFDKLQEDNLGEDINDYLYDSKSLDDALGILEGKIPTAIDDITFNDIPASITANIIDEQSIEVSCSAYGKNVISEEGEEATMFSSQLYFKWVGNMLVSTEQKFYIITMGTEEDPYAYREYKGYKKIDVDFSATLEPDMNMSGYTYQENF